jgi:hypothetical protein
MPLPTYRQTDYARLLDICPARSRASSGDHRWRRQGVPGRLPTCRWLTPTTPDRAGEVSKGAMMTPVVMRK